MDADSWKVDAKVPTPFGGQGHGAEPPASLRGEPARPAPASRGDRCSATLWRTSTGATKQAAGPMWPSPHYVCLLTHF